MAPKKEILEDALPTEEEARIQAKTAYAPALTSSMQSVISRLQVLAHNPPQVILFEGGDFNARLSIAKFWASLTNCKEIYKPCLHCVTCLEIANVLTPDFLFFDGTKASIKIDDMRALKPLVATAPQQLKTRTILFYEAGAFTTEAANSLLKILEEPNNTTQFIITAPQRERVLPTLVSRSLTVILPTYQGSIQSSEALEWLSALYIFFTSGKGWFDITGQKNTIDNTTALYIIHLLMEQFSHALAPLPQREPHALALYLQKKITAEKSLAFYRLSEEAQSALLDTVNPALVLDYLLTQTSLVLK